MTNINWGVIGIFLVVVILPTSFFVPRVISNWKRFQGKRKIRRQLMLYKNLLKTHESKGREGLLQANEIVNFNSRYNRRTHTILRGYFNWAAFKELPNPAVFGITYQIEFFETILENPDNYFR